MGKLPHMDLTKDNVWHFVQEILQFRGSQ